MLVLLFLVATSLAQQSSPAPVAQAAEIRAQIQRVEDALPKITDRGAALFLEAKFYARLGEPAKALALVKECVALNEGFDPGGSSSLQSLQSYPEFRELAEEVRRHDPPVHKARVAFTVADKDLFPEGLAYEPSKHVFYMGSMHRRKIVEITESGKASDFVKADLYNLLEVGGVRMDPVDHTVWIASDHDGASELVHFDSQGKLLERFPASDPGRHIFNDLVVRQADVYTTDTSADQVYRLDRKLHTFATMTLNRPLFGPNGITFSDDANVLYVADDMGVIRVDLRNNTSQEVDPGKGNTLAGLDGMYWYKGSLLGLQYGRGSFRVVRWRLSPDGVKVASTEILEQRTPLVSFPTTGAIAGEKLYFMANTGIGNLDHDRIVDPTKLEPVHIAVVPLK
ncbi:MAG TPA: hypothetical protein VI685_02475 [Candidatus Angelobacter sp.]